MPVAVMLTKIKTTKNLKNRNHNDHKPNQNQNKTVMVLGFDYFVSIFF